MMVLVLFYTLAFNYYKQVILDALDAEDQFRKADGMN